MHKKSVEVPARQAAGDFNKQEVIIWLALLQWRFRKEESQRLTRRKRYSLPSNVKNVLKEAVA